MSVAENLGFGEADREANGTPSTDGNSCSDARDCDPDPSIPSDPDKEGHCFKSFCQDGVCKSIHADCPPSCSGPKADQECDDGDRCTWDTCVDTDAGFTCHHESTGGRGCEGCGWDQQCIDNDPCTSDFCLNGSCQHQPSNEPGCEPPPPPPCGPADENCCQSHSDCNDGNACTADTCNSETGACHYAPVDDGACRACNTVAGCVDDENGCTEEGCVYGVCVSEPLPPPCTPCVTDGWCEDFNPCTSDSCVGWACVNSPIPGCVPPNCLTGCDDGDPCTSDICENLACTHRYTCRFSG